MYNFYCRQEILEYGPTIAAADVENLRYLKACIWESCRTHPTTPGTRRVIPNDIVLNGFKIPKKTMLFWSNHVLGMDEKQFPEPEQFR
jgi:cytochrome P450